MATATADGMKIAFADVEGDIDSDKSVALLPHNTSVRQIVDKLDLDLDYRLTKNKKQSKYRDSVSGICIATMIARSTSASMSAVSVSTTVVATCVV